MITSINKKIRITKVDQSIQQSSYDWFNIDHSNRRIGKIRSRVKGKTITIYSIHIFPEFQRRGFAQQVIHWLKEQFNCIIADRVRFTAIGFWEKMGFTLMPDGNFIWEREIAPKKMIKLHNRKDSLSWNNCYRISKTLLTEKGM